MQLHGMSNYIVRQKKGTTCLLQINCLNTQCNLTKFSTLIVNEYYHRWYLLNFWNLRSFLQVTVQKCDVGHYVINHGVMKLMVTG